VADHCHKRETEARRKPKALAVIGPLAFLATASVVGIGVAASDPGVRDMTKLGAAAAHVPPSESRTEDPVTRSADRTKTPPPVSSYAPKFMSKAAIQQAVAHASQVRWSTDDLNIWTQPGDKAKQIGELEAGKKVVATGRRLWGRTEIVLKGESRWVSDGYLSHDKPLGAGAGLSMEPCVHSGESGLTDNAVYVFRSVCAAFPEISTYGGWSNHGEHASGRAIDIMTSDVALGTAIAEFLREHASELHLYDVIWRQHIWTPVRASEGWRSMPSRGSTTANHYDHVHVSVY
jgi:hypothetical protein